MKLRWDNPAAATLGEKVAPDKDALLKLEGMETKHPALSLASAYLLVLSFGRSKGQAAREAS